MVFQKSPSTLFTPPLTPPILLHLRYPYELPLCSISPISTNMPPLRSARAPIRRPRHRNQELDVFTRTRLVKLKTVARWSYKQIHEQYPVIPISTIKYTVQQANKRTDNQTSSRSGRPRKLNENDKDKVLATINDNPRVTYEDLLATIDNKVKRTSVWRLLHEEGRRKW